MLDAVVAQNEQAISIDGEKNNYKKVIMVEQDKAERQGVTLMKIDSAMKEVQKRIQQTVKKRMKMLEHYAKILLKVEEVEGNIEKVNAEIATFEFEIKVLHIEHLRCKSFNVLNHIMIHLNIEIQQQYIMLSLKTMTLYVDQYVELCINSSLNPF